MYCELIKVKNTQIWQAIKFEKKNRTWTLSHRDARAVYDCSTNKQIAMNICLGYIDTLMDVAADPEIRIDLDLTYNTLKKLTEAIAYASIVSGSSAKQENTAEEKYDIAQSTFAAYLTFLAANEEGCEITVTMLGDALRATKQWENSLSGLQVETGPEDNRVNFFAAVRDDIEVDEKEIRIAVDNAAEAYKKLTGKDLREYGLESVCAQF